MFAIFAISCNHAVNRSYSNYSGQWEEFLSLSLAANILKAVVTVFSRLGVPMFLMITGVLILNKKMDTPQQIRRFYRHNVLGLLITTEIWYFLLFWFLVLLSPSVTLLEDQGLLHTLFQLVQTMLFQNQLTTGNMWYMPMILSLYLAMPIFIVAKEKLPGWVLCIPLALSLINGMLIPAFNSFQTLRGGGLTLTTAITEGRYFSIYYLYIFAGYFIGSGKLKRLKDYQVGILALVCFLLCCGYQIYAYSRPSNYLVTEATPYILVCAVFLFDFIRRKAHWFVRFRKPITWLSEISFGIYFVHIVIMELVNWYGGLTLRPSLRMVVLEVVAFGGSVVVIGLLSKIPFCRKYLFMIKGGESGC